MRARWLAELFVIPVEPRRLFARGVVVDEDAFLDDVELFGLHALVVPSACGQRTDLRAIAAKWDTIGKVPRDRGTELERRLRALEKRVRDAGSSDWSDPQAEARAEQFRSRAEQFEQQAEKAEAAGRTAEAEKARANARQWREWAETAEGALGKKR